MATLSTEELVDIRQELAKKNGAIPWSKPQINAAAQAVEDIFAGAAFQNALVSAINTATSPLVLNGTQKRRLVAFVAKRLFFRDQV